MSDPDGLIGLFLHFLLLSLMSIGGTIAVLPDMYRYVVEANQLMTPKQFADAYAIAQGAPGPNILYVTLIGWHVAGLWGAIATTLALVLPTGTVTLIYIRLSAGSHGTRFARAFRSGLAPIAIGFMLSSGWVLARSVNEDWRGWVLTAFGAALVLRSAINPLWLLAAGALAGIAGFV